MGKRQGRIFFNLKIFKKNSVEKSNSARNKHGCWRHQDRVVIFGGFGSRDPRNPFNGDFETSDGVIHHVDRYSYDHRVWNNDFFTFDPEPRFHSV